MWKELRDPPEPPEGLVLLPVVAGPNLAFVRLPIMRAEHVLLVVLFVDQQPKRPSFANHPLESDLRQPRLRFRIASADV